jgi:hypothetical protein
MGNMAVAQPHLHLFADWSGHRRNPEEIVAVLRDAGADLDARTEGRQAVRASAAAPNRSASSPNVPTKTATDCAARGEA